MDMKAACDICPTCIRGNPLPHIYLIGPQSGVVKYQRVQETNWHLLNMVYKLSTCKHSIRIQSLDQDGALGRRVLSKTLGLKEAMPLLPLLKPNRRLNSSNTLAKSNQLPFYASSTPSYRHSIEVIQECPLLAAIELNL